jgi:hypothetical protein
MRWEIFKALRDLAENLLESVGVERKMREKPNE